MREKGFSFLELLLVMSLSLLVLMAAFEFFGITRNLFIKLKDAQENNLAIQAALDKIRIDLLHAGFGLEPAISTGVVEGITAGSSLAILSQETSYALATDCSSGETRIPLEKASGLIVGSRVCLEDEQKAERHVISSIEGSTVVLSESLENSYTVEDARLILLEEVTYYFDERTSVLRRKVNASPAQPLLDDAGLFEFSYLKENNLVRIKLADKNNLERAHEISIFPKNLGLILP